jgi:RNA polymerase sigma factor (sigma-70 family)
LGLGRLKGKPLLDPTAKEQKSIIKKLFTLLQTGDLDSFGEVISPVRGRIVRLAQQRLQRDEVEDVVQQTLSTLWEKRSSVRDPDHLMPFLFQIMRNKMGDSYRRKRYQQEIRVTKNEPMDSLKDSESTNPELLLEEKELENVLKEAIDICAAENRLWGKILQLLQEGKSREEIRKELGDIPMATVYTRIYRARHTLINILKDEFGVEV